jgi:hypothetical protein
MSRTNAQQSTQQKPNVEFHLGKKGGLNVVVEGYKPAQITLQRQSPETPPSAPQGGGGGQGIVYDCLTAAQSLAAISLWAQQQNNQQLAAITQQMSAQVLSISQQVTRQTPTKPGKFISPTQQYNQQSQRSRKQRNQSMQNTTSHEMAVAG